METGQEIWLTWRSRYGAPGFIEVHNGVLVFGDATYGIVQYEDNRLCTNVTALDANSGEVLWSRMLTNFSVNTMPVFPDDNSTIIQDHQGNVYKFGLSDGSLHWSAIEDFEAKHNGTTYSEGGAMVSPVPPNSPPGTSSEFVYSCASPSFSEGDQKSEGLLTKRMVSNGTLVWEKVLPMPCHSWPVPSSDGKFVVAALGALNGPIVSFKVFIDEHFNVEFAEYTHKDEMELGEAERDKYNMPNLNGTIAAYDAATGEELWRWDAKPWGKTAAEGDEAGFIARLDPARRFACKPPQWSIPTVTADGTIYAGRSDGFIYAIKDGHEVDRFFAGAGSGNPGTSFAAGVMAHASCDTLHVFHVD